MDVIPNVPNVPSIIENKMYNLWNLIYSQNSYDDDDDDVDLRIPKVSNNGESYVSEENLEVDADIETEYEEVNFSKQNFSDSKKLPQIFSKLPLATSVDRRTKISHKSYPNEYHKMPQVPNIIYSFFQFFSFRVW